MKALSVQQPWACLLVEGVKKLEVRSWQTDYRGDLLICASAAPKNHFWHDQVDDIDRLLPAGCMIGIVRLVGIRPMAKKDVYDSLVDYVPGAYAWQVEPVAFCRPDKIIGRLGLFDVPDDKIMCLKPPDWLFSYPPPQGDVKLTKACPIL